MASPNATFTEMVTTTLRHAPREVADNVSDHNALLWKLKRGGKIKSVSGGYELQVNLDYAENSTFQRYSGYDQLNTGASDVLTAANYAWKQSAIHVVASGAEIRQNSGKEAMVNLVKARKTNAMRTARNKMSVDIYSDGTASNQMNGLAALVTTDGTGTVGGIVAGTYTWWKNQFREATGTNTAASPSVSNAVQFKGDMNALWLSCVRGTDKPDCIVMSQDFYALFELGEQDKQRYADSDMAKAGFTTLKYKSADVIFDDNSNFSTTAEKAYFLNTDYLWLYQHGQASWTPDDQKRPTNQDAVIVPMYWMGNMATSNRSLQGILFDAA